MIVLKMMHNLMLVALPIVVAAGFVFNRPIISNCVYSTANGQLH
jgi:hypothetical protein